MAASFAAASLVLGLVSSSVLWFPGLVRVAAARFGVQSGPSERSGWARWTIRDLSGDWNGVRVRVGRLELPQLVPWLAALARPRPSDNASWIRIEDWELTVDARPTAAPDTPPVAWGTILETTTNLLDRSRHLGGAARLERGRVVVVGRTFEIPEAICEPDALTLALRGTNPASRASASLRRRAEGLQLTGTVGLEGWETTIEGSATRSGARWQLAGRLERGAERLDWEAVLDDRTAGPRSVSIRTEGFSGPPPPGWRGSWQTRMTADWREGNGRFDASVTGNLGPPGRDGVHPVAARASGEIAGDRVEIGALQVDSQSLRAALSRPVSLRLGDTSVPAGTALTWEVDLAVFGRPGLAGRLRGEAAIETNAAPTGTGLPWPRTRVRLEGDDLAFGEWAFVRAEADGFVDWPRFVVDRLRAEAPEGGRLTLTGQFDGTRRTVSEARGSFDGLLPASWRFGETNGPFPRIHAVATASGPLTNLVVSAEARTETPWSGFGLKPMTFEARGTGTGFEITELRLIARRDEASLTLVGSGSFRDQPELAIRGKVLSCDLVRTDEDSLRLAAPFGFGIRRPNERPADRAETGVAWEWTLEEARWQGRTGAIALAFRSDWPERGRGSLRWREIPPSWINDWLTRPVTGFVGWQVRTVDASAEWDRGPVTARVEWDVATATEAFGPVEIKGAASANAVGTSLTDLTVSRAGSVGARGSASIPATLPMPTLADPTGRARWWRDEVLPAPLSGNLELPIEGWPWTEIASRWGIHPQGPRARLDWGGTVTDPEAKLSLSAERLRVTPADWEGPPLEVEDLELRGRVSTREGVIERARLRVEGQEASARGRLPWDLPARPTKPVTPAGSSVPAPTGIGVAANTDSADAAAGTGAAGEWRPRWDLAEASLEIPRARLDPFARPIRNLLQPGGEVRASIQYREGAASGWLEVSNVSTRAIGPVGVFRDLNLRLGLEGRRVTIERGEVQLSGQPIAVSGWLTLPDEGERAADVRLTATNLALVRTSEILLRGDLDLTILRTNRASPPVVGGAVTLRDSVVMMDLRDLVSIDLERPNRRPPFFSVAEAPLADWQLDLRVRGERFARVLSPVFRGTVSADLALRGSLRQPQLLGQGMVDGGRLAFPFGQLEVQQARIQFPESDPYRPRLEGRAEGMSFGYSIGLDLTGTLTEPAIAFSSVPPMSTREVLQMLMSGSLPRSEYSYSTSGKAQKVGTYLAGDLVSQFLGDPLAEPRLTVQSGQRIASDGRLTYGVEYRLADRWYAVGEYDRWNQLGAGLRWRVFEK